MKEPSHWKAIGFMVLALAVLWIAFENMEDGPKPLYTDSYNGTTIEVLSMKAEPYTFKEPAPEVVPLPEPTAPGPGEFPVLTVISAEDGKPVRGAKVYEQGERGTIRCLGQTDEKGQLPLPTIGTADLLIQRSGYDTGFSHGGVQNRTAKMNPIPAKFM